MKPGAFGMAALRTSLVVGTTLTLTNHPGLFREEEIANILLPIVLNFLVPFLVAGYSRWALLRRGGAGSIRAALAQEREGSVTGWRYKLLPEKER